ncbi:MAG: chemotaxis protein CheW [Gallionella sp.]
MSKRYNLPGVQQELIHRLKADDLDRTQVTTLGVHIAGRKWLVDMADIGHVLPLPTLTVVPLTKQWFRGVVNVRGNLYCVTDMAAFLYDGMQHDAGADNATTEPGNRLLLVASKYAANAALLVDKVQGLHDVCNWKKSNDDGHSVFIDDQGTSWHKLSVPLLLQQPEFLHIGI